MIGITVMEAALEQLVWQRAHGRCEYCRIAQAFDASPFQVDHIIARKHGGATVANNLALSCLHCNLFKGPNIAGIDPETSLMSRLFHPRLDDWTEHFCCLGAELYGRTPVGRTTIQVLSINDVSRVVVRDALISEGHAWPFEYN